jgi:predicted nucleic acid-binding protein
LRRTKPHGGVLAWFESVADADPHLSAVTIGEIEAGIEIPRETDPDKANAIAAWLEQVAATFNILAMDARAFRRWAKLMHRRSDHLMEDAMIAATAAVHDLIIVTRNVQDFEQFGVGTFDPFGVPNSQ